MKVQCQSPTYVWPCTVTRPHPILCSRSQGSDLPVQQGPAMTPLSLIVHEVSARDSYGLDLAYNILYLLLTEVCFSEIMGRMACSWNSIWWMCSLNSPHPTKTHLEKESPNLGRRWAQSGVVDWFAVLPFVCNPFSGAVTNSTTFTTGQGETCKRAAPTSSA